jgi:beta-glucosidase
MSYTQFSIGKPKLEKASIKINGSTKVTVEITNTGKMAGDEVVQMYIRDKISSVTRPVKELKGFKRISLNPGETKKVIMDIKPEHLAFYDINMNYVVEPGEFDIMVGNSSRDEDLQVVQLKVIG